MQYVFERLGIATVWCNYDDDNEKSKRVQEKCGLH
ncbi:MAG: GNAT family N-acetyltransferase [Clostridia bacterium]